MTEPNQCKGCLKTYSVFVLSDHGYCPKCEAAKNDTYRVLKKKPGAYESRDTPEQYREMVEKENADAKAEEERRQRQMEQVAKTQKEHEERVQRLKEAAPAFEERYKAAIEDNDAHQREESAQKAKARRVLAQRELARRHFFPYVNYTTPNYEAGWVHKDVCRRLERFSRQVERGESPRLMITLPPRHGKSTLGTQKFPAWHLGRLPDHEVMVASYSASLANKFSKMVRAIMRSKDHQNVFKDCRLDEDDASVEGWSTTKGGAYFPTGVGGPATGRGAHVLVIDDPVKNREEAESETVREAVKDWYTSTAYTRLAPGGGVLVIQTRWHDDDLAGWLRSLSDNDEGDKFEVIDYPAIAEKDEKHRKAGEALHPERFPLSALARIKKAIGKRDWAALYQQNPIPDSGDFFKKEDLRWYNEKDRPALDDLAIYAAADFAIGQKEANDSSVIYVVGIDRDMRIWVLDRYKGRWGTYEIIKHLCLMYKTWQPEITGGEKGHIEMSISPVLDKEKIGLGAGGLFMKPLAPGRRDKQARARPIQGMVESHQVFFPADAPWIEDMLQEVLRFPAGKHDDDCLVAGTRIATPQGDRPIETLRPGDAVLTPAGPRTLTAARQTGVEPVWRVEAEDGTVIEGKGSHPVYTAEHGFVRIDALQCGDSLIQETPQWHASKPSRSMASHSGVTPTRHTTPTAPITSFTPRTTLRRSICTAMYGKLLSDLFQTVSTYIIKPTTWLALIQRSLNACRQMNMLDGIAPSEASVAALTNTWPIWTEFAKKPLTGTEVKPGENGTVNTAGNLGKIANHPSPFVSDATLNTKPTFHPVPGSVQNSASSENTSKTTPVRRATSLSHCQNVENANDVEKPINLKNAPDGLSVHVAAERLKPVRVKIVSLTDRVEPVYNLTVEDQHVFFANGVLTHNCDALAWIGQMIVMFSPRPVPKAEKKRSWRDKLDQYVEGASRGNTGAMSA